MEYGRRLVGARQRMLLDQSCQGGEPREMPLDTGAVLGANRQSEHVSRSADVG